MRSIVLLFISSIFLSACEAPLVLDGVNAGKASSVRRTDIFMAATSLKDQTYVVGSEGVILSAAKKLSANNSFEWKRLQVEGRPAFIDIVACEQGALAALAMNGEVWVSIDEGQSWNLNKISSPEVPQAITCKSDGSLWVVGSFTTILSSSDLGKTWNDHSMQEDMILSTVQFHNERDGVITGEFGTVLTTEDGGQTWTFGEPIPKEFFPLAGLFKDGNTGWVVGLNGIVYETNDGGETWLLESTATKSPLFEITIHSDKVIAVGDEGSIIYKNLNSTTNEWLILETEAKSRSFYRIAHSVSDENIVLAGAVGSINIINVKN